jgi:hypothetical protein
MALSVIAMEPTGVRWLLTYNHGGIDRTRYETDGDNAKRQVAAMRSLPEYSEVHLYRCEEIPPC